MILKAMDRKNNEKIDQQRCDLCVLKKGRRIMDMNKIVMRLGEKGKVKKSHNIHFLK